MSLNVYCAVGPALITFALDVESETLARLDAVTLPARVQCAAPHPERPMLYAACADRGDSDADEQPFYLCTLLRDAEGNLEPQGEPVRLPARPIHCTVDHAGRRLLTAYSQPALLTVHALDDKGRIGDPLPAPEPRDVGPAPHQVRVTDNDTHAIVAARGKKGFGKPSYVEGSLEVLQLDGRQPAHVATVRPDRSAMPRGFSPRAIDVHPNGKFLYVALEEQSQLAVFPLDGTRIGSAPLFVRDALADPANKRPRQDGGNVRVHPDGRAVYVGNRNDGYAGGASGPSWLTPDPVPVFGGGENSIAVFAMDGATGEPTRLQHADTRGLHPREFAMDPEGRVLLVANSAPTCLADGDTLTEVPAGLVLFRIRDDGTLDYVSRHDLETGGEMLWWMGLVA